ncbi:MAG: sugar ABC transporter permease [Brachybacterium sp.]|nr:sugar ABC transporter permease [Brachybacterium sp.]
MTALLSQRPVRRPRGVSLIEAQKRKLFIPLVGPAFLFYTLLVVVPSAAALWISFHRWPGAGPMEFVGLRNYPRVAKDPLFQQAFLNTMLILVVVGVTIFVLAFSMSLVLRNMWGKGLVRSVIFFPHLINALVFGALAGFIFNPGGLVNTLLAPLGVTEPPAWLAQDNIFVLIMITLVLTHTGYFTTILMAGVDRIPPEYFEVASLAGCSAFQRLRYVIIPLTWEVFATCAVLWTISSVKIFELIWVFGGSSGAGIPPTSSWTAAVYTYVTAFSGQSIPAYGAATASAIISLVTVSIIVLLMRRVMRRDAIQY